MVSAHLKIDDGPTQCIFYDEPDFKTRIREAVATARMLVGVNIKFDLHWLRNLGIRPNEHCRVWDCMVAEFILSGQTNSFAGLEDLSKRYPGVGEKNHDIEEYWSKGISTESIPRDVVESRGNDDVDLTYSVYRRQLDDERCTPSLHRLIILDGLDLLVLADMEYNGFKYDTEKSLAKASELLLEQEEIENELRSFAPAEFTINFDSGDHLSCLLYGGKITERVYTPCEEVLKSGPNKGSTRIVNRFQYERTITFPRRFQPIRGTEYAKSTEGKEFWSTAEDVLLQLKAKTREQRRLIGLLNRRNFISKLVGTYLTAIPALIEKMGWKDNYVHGQFNQVVARTGRLSSSAPNLQNSPEDCDEFFVTRYS